MAVIGQGAGNINALASRFRPLLLDPVHDARGKVGDGNGPVDRRVERDRHDVEF